MNSLDYHFLFHKTSVLNMRVQKTNINMSVLLFSNNTLLMETWRTAALSVLQTDQEARHNVTVKYGTAGWLGQLF